MEERLLTKKQVCAMVGYSRQHLARLVAAGKFPAPLKPFGRQGRAMWMFTEVIRWISDHAAKRAPTMLQGV